MSRPSKLNSRHCALSAIVATLAVAATSSFAHDLGTTETLITLGEQRFEIVMECDLDALALGAAPTANDAELLAALEPATEGPKKSGAGRWAIHARGLAQPPPGESPDETRLAALQRKFGHH